MNKEQMLLALEYMYYKRMKWVNVYVIILLLACVALGLIAYVASDTVSFIPAVAGLQ